MLMGVLCAIGSAIVASARLNAATNALGTNNELYVIAATDHRRHVASPAASARCAGAMLGAVVMQSLQSGMQLMGIESPLQNIVSGLVLVIAVGIDTLVPQADPCWADERRSCHAMADRRLPPLVEMKNIYVSFGGVHAVENASISLYPGEVVGLVGGNGAGKSTLMKVLSGAYHARFAGRSSSTAITPTINNPRDAKALRHRDDLPEPGACR